MSPAQPPRVLVLTEIPTPYRAPFYARLAERPELELEVVFCSARQPDRPWDVDRALGSASHRVLPGRSVNLRRGRLVYEMNPGIVPLLYRGRYDALVVGGYGVLTTQAAIAWAWASRTPYLLHSESHLLNRRPAWLRAAKRATVAPVVRRAAAGLAVGSEAARYLVAYGMPPDRIRIVPNTIDVARYREMGDAARARGAEIRARRGLPERYVLFAGRLVDSKGIDDLLAALDVLGDERPDLVVAGTGPLAPRLEGVPHVHAVGFQQEEALVELFALADATVVPSRLEPWGVVVNEALAAGSPVVATDAVGAAVDLVEDGVNGRVVPAGDVAALAAALAAPRPPGDPAAGRIAGWTYDFAVEQFLEALELALGAWSASTSPQARSSASTTRSGS